VHAMVLAGPLENPEEKQLLHELWHEASYRVHGNWLRSVHVPTNGCIIYQGVH